MESCFVPRYCDVCDNILPLPNINSAHIICSICHSTNEIGTNTIVIEESYSTTVQSFSTEVLIRLARTPTIEKIIHQCSCGCDIASKIHDANYIYTLVCDKCYAIYEISK